MKTRFSLKGLLHNDRLMLLFSFVLAIFVWAAVVYGPSNVETRTVTLSVYVDLSGSYADHQNIRVVGNNTFTVEVQVQGPRAVIGSLGATDIRVRPNVDAIQNAGKFNLSLTPTKNSAVHDYSFVSVNPSTITVECDYWVQSTFPLTADISAVKVAEQTPPLILGTPQIKADGVEAKSVSLEGPKSVLNRIYSVVARVESATPLSDDTMFNTPLVALDSAGNEVDISSCTVVGLPSGSVNVTVPVLMQKKVYFTYTLAHVPPALQSNKNLVSLSVDAVTLIGSRTQLQKAEALIANLGTIDFDRLLPDRNVITKTIDLPDNVRIQEGVTEVVITVDLSAYTERTFAVSTEQLQIVNRPADKQVQVPYALLSQVRIGGPSELLDTLTAQQLQIRLDLGTFSSAVSGSVQVPVRIQILGEKADSLWVYYGENGYDLIVTVR